MHEVWVKKTIWRRYLVEDKDIVATTETLKHDDERGDEIVADCWDVNNEVEYDIEEVIRPIEFKARKL
ncbi:hypothetical protein KAR91_59060 [Candidatus Pacearchaeota archaeon]|nr:hypothetical protein [Candidatus Pacearchaeota archaeon]